MYNIVATLALSVLIESSSFLQVTRKTIKSRMRLKFGQIRSRITGLAAYERPQEKNNNALIMGEMLSPL